MSPYMSREKESISYNQHKFANSLTNNFKMEDGLFDVFFQFLKPGEI